MRSRVILAFFLMSLAAIVPVFSQEGHPLTGSWHGEWTAGGQQNHVVMFLKWDTKNVVGTINPGPNAMPLKVGTLNPDWTVHFEADGKDASGKPVKVVIDGKMDNIGSYNRTVTGTWTQGTVKGNFKMTRD